MILTNFEYGCARLQDITINGTPAQYAGRRAFPDLVLAGRPLKTTARFWESLHRRFGFTPNIFRYFTYAEVFQRISEVAKNDRILYCIEHRPEQSERLLGVASPTSPRITAPDLQELLERHSVESLSYDKGVITSRHNTRHGGQFDIAGDAYENRFVIETPIDGFGRPSVFLSMIRQVCANGAIAYAPAFRSEINLGRGGDAVSYALVRVLEGFNNDEGFAALRQRFESAATSWTSIHEAQKLRRTLVGLHNRGEVLRGRPLPKILGSDGYEALSSSPILATYDRLIGDLSGVYGVANLDAISPKRQRTLPAGCKVYELLNFASEIATHHSNPGGNRMVQAFIGDLVSNEFDLEGTANEVADWRDFFITNRAAAESKAALDRRGRR